MKKLSILLLFCFSLASLFAFSGEESDYYFYNEADYEKDYEYLLNSLSEATSDEEKSEILWRLSRTQLTLTDEKKDDLSEGELLSLYGDYGADDTPKEEDKSSSFYYAYTSLKYKETPNGYHWLASSVGRAGQVHGALNSLAKASPMRKLEKKALEDFPFFTLETDSWYVLAILYRSLPGSPISFGNDNYAISYIRKCIMTQDNENRSNGTNYLELAEELYKRNWSENKRSKEFASMLKKYEKALKKGEKAVEVNKYYEGYLSTQGEPFYVRAELSAISDRTEAISILDYARRLIEFKMKSSLTPQSYEKMEKEKEKIENKLKEWGI